MSQQSCSACNDLREYAPEFVVNGVTDNVCESLQANTGLNPNLETKHKDCEDLHDVNDCLVGNMDDEVEEFEVCDWKDFMHQFIPNLYETLKAMICAICGLWKAVTISSYVGVLQLHRTSQGLWNLDPSYSDGESGYHSVNPPFQTATLTGTLPSGVLAAASDYKSVKVNNTTGIPLLVNATFNCSIRTNQNIACCFIVVTRDGVAVGQTPFVASNTYDQQVAIEPFILNAGASTTLSWYFAVGHKNNWYAKAFGINNGYDFPDSSALADAEIQCCLENNTSAADNQQSYFDVQVTGIPQGFNR